MSEYGTSSVFRQLPSVPFPDTVWEWNCLKSELGLFLNGTSLDCFRYKEKNVIYKTVKASDPN